MLRKLLNDEVKTVRRTNVVKGRKFSEMLDAAVNKYTNQALSAAEVIAELVKVAKEMKGEEQRAEQLNLSVGELAFFDALAQNGSAVTEMGDEKLRDITVDLVQSVQSSVTIDWQNRDSVKPACVPDSGACWPSTGILPTTKSTPLTLFSTRRS